jgi:aryl-alcohol dehydrogenase-like predicted oxidoreductase
MYYPFQKEHSMDRRQFLKHSIGVLAAVPGLYAGHKAKRADDVVELGPARVKLSRLAMGTGTRGGRGSSNQTRQLGLDGLADLYWYGYDNGVTFWDSADSYGSHPHLRHSLKNVKREKVTIMTKTRARTAEEMRSDLDRFRKEINTDYVDIVLLHARTSPNWDEEAKGAMEVLSEAKEKGIIRTHGISCHSIEALRLAARHPWVEVDLARLNPIGSHMDADPAIVLSVLKQMKANGKGIIGMKILGEGDLRFRVDEALRYALSQDVLSCFTIGAESRSELADLIKRIPALERS